MGRFQRRWTMDDGRWHTGLNLSFFCVCLVVLNLLGAGERAEGSRHEQRPPRKRFTVVPDRGPGGDDAAAYCESVVRKTGVAILVRSPRDADYVLYPAVQL